MYSKIITRLDPPLIGNIRDRTCCQKVMLYGASKFL